jgi:surfeit locus 1 family protein
MMFRPLTILTLFTVPALAVLVWLGNWQWERYGEAKARGVALPPEFATLSLYPVPVANARSVQIYGLFKGQSAWRHAVPVALEPDGPPAGVAVIALTLSAQAPEGTPLATLAPLTAPMLAAPPRDKRDAFTPRERLAEGYGFTLDPVPLLSHWGLPVTDTADLRVFEPQLLPVSDPDNRLLQGTIFEAENPWANPALHDELPAERHLGYAITWWGLALALIGVYLAFHVSRGRLRLSSPG